MITELKGFTADAEIMGEIREVQYADGSLIISDLELHEATEILKRLSDKAIAAVELPEEHPVSVPAPAKKEEKPPAAAAPPSPPTSKPVASDPPAPPTAPQLVPAPSAAAPAPAPAPAPAQTAPQAPVSAPEEIVNAQRLRDVVDYLTQKAGLKTAEDVLAAIEKYKPASVTIQRASGVEERVRKMLAAGAAA